MAQAAQDDAPNYLDPDIHKLSNITYENIHNFHVPDHLGKDISVGLGHETLTGFDAFDVRAIQDASNTTPIEVITDDTGMVNGQTWTVSGVQGNTAANGVWVIHLTGAGGVQLLGSVGNGDYVFGGIIYRDKPPTVLDRFALFARPYWNGAAWVNKWREETEMFLFQNVGNDNDTKIFIANPLLYDLAALDPSGEVFNNSYFLGWTISFMDAPNGPVTGSIGLVVGCGFTVFAGTTYYYLQIDVGGILAGPYIAVCRNWHPDYELTRAISPDVQSFVHNLLSEARITTGNDNADRGLMLGFREKSWVFAAPFKALDSMVLQPSVLEVGAKFIKTLTFTKHTTTDDPLFVGTYHGAITLVTDDGQESIPLATAILVNGSPAKDGKITLTIRRGALPLRARKFRLYVAREGYSTLSGTVEKDTNSPIVQGTNTVFLAELSVGDSITIPGGGGPETKTVKEIYSNLQLRVDSNFTSTANNQTASSVAGTLDYFLTLEVGLYDGESTWASSSNEDTLTLTVHKFDIDNQGAEIVANIGRGVTDDGVARYLHAAVIDRNTYITGVRKANVLYPNKVFVSATHGDGSNEYDAFPTDGPHNIDLEFSDGDEVKAIGSVDSNIVCVKRRSVVVVVQTSTGYDRKLVTKGYGISSFRTMVSWDDYLLWLDYNAVVLFSTRGIRVMNYGWLQDLRVMSDATKEAAIGAIDRVNRQYMLLLGNRIYCMDLDSFEWTIQDYAKVPARFAVDIIGTVDFLNGLSLETIGKGSGQQDTVDVTSFFKSNEVQYDSPDGDFDVNPISLWCRYQSDTDLTLRLFKNATEEEIGESPWTLKKENTRVRVQPLQGRCSSFRIEISTLTTAPNQTFRILRLGAKYEVMAAGGSELTE
jgi:hypothetical protein